MFNSKGGEARRWSGAAVFVLGMVLLTLLPLSGSLQSQAGLAGYTIDPYSPGNWYTGIILQDMDCDGNPEVLAGNRNTSSVEIWKYNPGLRTLSLIDSIDFPYHVHDIKTADFDRDGDMDVVVGLRSYGLYYATNTGSPCTVGNWSSESIDSQYSWQVLVEDFDNDGELDIFDGVDYGPIHIFYGDGAGNFAQGNSVFDPDTDMRLPAGFNAVDLNGDGLLDLIGVDANYLRVFLNPGDRAGDWTSIGPTAPFAENDNAVRSILNPSAGDVDNDGYIDLAAYISVRPSGPFEVVLFKGGASGGNLVWEKQVLDTVDGEAEGQHAGIVDLNGDGNLDIHIGGATLFNNLLVYLGDGLGGFTPAHLVLDHGVGGMNSFVVRDLNGDGGLDIITTRSTSAQAQYGGFEILWAPVPTATLTLVKETDPDGGTGFPFTLIGEVGGWGSLGGEPGQFTTPMGVTVDNNGDVYVVDHHNARVQKFDKTGTFVLMQLPVVGYDVAVDASGNIFVTDPTSVSFGIKKYRSDGAYLAGADSFRSGGVAVDRVGNVYVANTFLSQIQKFDNNLVLLDTWGELGNGNGQFNLPGGIAVYDDGVNIIVYVADTGNGRIQKFDENGTYLGQWGSLSTGFSRPGAVEVDAAGNVYVADSGNGSIQKFDGDGNFLTSWYGVGADGIAVNTEGHIYVTEPHRVRVFVDQSATLDDDDSVPLALTPGVFDVSELVPDKWTLTDIICTGGDPQTGEDGVMLSLASNDDVTCTFTNTADPVSITVVKTVIGQPPATDWQYTGTLETFTLPAAGGERRFGSLDFGEYTITETAKPGYAQAVSCDNGETGEGSVTVSLQPGEAVVCTFTNTAQPGSITVIKEVVGQAPAGEWAYTGDLGEFNIPAAGGRQVFEPLDAGSYTINEAAKAAYSQSAACDTGETGTGSVTVDLAPGENVTCTFINTAQPGAITIIKEVVGQPPAADWAFTGDLDAFTLPAIGGASEPFTNLVAGDYTVTETAVAGYDQAVSCDSGESGTGSVTVSLQPGEAVICTFTNTAQPGSITIVKEVAGQLSAADWRFNLDQAGFTLPAAGGQTTFSRIPAGDHLLIEETVTGYDQSVTCDSGEKGVGSVIISLQPGETVVCTFTNTYVTVPPPSLRIFLSTTTSGMTADGVSFGSEDILLWDGHAWSNWFDGSAVGLEPLKARHNINAFSILDPEGDDLIFSFAQNRRHVPGIANPVDGMDLVRWDGSTFSVYFDGSDVGLTNKTQEKIDALHVIDTTLTPNNGENCVAYLLISTQGPGKIPNPAGGQIKFGGEDVLGFCATSLGENTTGQWEMVLDGSAEGMPRNATDSISLSDDGRMMYLTTQNTFLVDGAAGGHSMVYRYDFGTGEFSGPIFSAPANGLPAKVNGLQVTGILP